MVWVVSECAFGAEITEVVAVASSEQAGRQAAEEHWKSHGNGPLLLWGEDGRCRVRMTGRVMSDPYLVEEFPVV